MARLRRHGRRRRQGPFVLTRGEGAYVFDADDNRYLDATAGLWFANIGHGRAEVGEAVAAQLSRLAHFSGFGDHAADVSIALAERLAALAPVPDSKVFFTSGGSDSVDTAAKLARRYWHEVGRPGKTVMVGRSKAYHGMHAAGTSLAGIPANGEGYGELVVDVETINWDDAKSLLGLIERIGEDRIAAFFCEPIIGAGGIICRRTATWRRFAGSAATTTSCSSPTRWSPGSAASAVGPGSRRRASAWSRTWSPRPRA